MLAIIARVGGESTRGRKMCASPTGERASGK